MAFDFADTAFLYAPVASGPVGTEVLANTDFATGQSPWLSTNSAAFGVSAGKLTGTGSAGTFFYQPAGAYVAAMTAGNYRLRVTIDTLTAGAVRAVFNNYAIDQSISTAGTATIDFAFGGGGDTTFNLQSQSFAGTISRVSLLRLP